MRATGSGMCAALATLAAPTRPSRRPRSSVRSVNTAPARSPLAPPNLNVVLTRITLARWLCSRNWPYPRARAAPAPSPGACNVVLRDSEDAAIVAKAQAKQYGMTLRHIYQYGLRGYAARIPA